MARAFAEIAFTPQVRTVQEEQGSANANANFLLPHVEGRDRLGEAETEFISARDGFYQATVSETGWPYVQFRGGSAGFIRIIDETTIAYADLSGNRQYISAGNLRADGRISLILMDYPNQRRLKLWGRARLIEAADDPDLIASLHDGSGSARPERAVVITIEALDWNCPQHIPRRFTLEELAQKLAPIREEVARLREENDHLKSAFASV